MGLLRRILPGVMVPELIRRTRTPAVGKVDLGRVKPLSQDWGFDRGKPIDRYYIERFLAGHSDDVRGRVLEIGSNDYTLRFGGDRVARSRAIRQAVTDEGTLAITPTRRTTRNPRTRWNA